MGAGRTRAWFAVGLLLMALAACGSSTKVSVGPLPPPPPSLNPDPGTAAQRADRVVAVQRDLGVDMHYSLPTLVTTLSKEVPVSCIRAADDQFHRSELQTSDQQQHETADHWSRVEAGFIAGACPQQLQLFFASLTRIGNGDIASKLAGQLKTLGVTN